MTPNIEFRSIRVHGGSRDRAFEELCFQLIPFLEHLPQGTELIRHGTPDGGVEFLAALPDGNVWGWQAKYLFALGNKEFGQLDRSARDALDAFPQLTRYTFCLPYNRPAGKVLGTKSAMQKWEDHCNKWERWAADRGMKVQFRYVGESELLSALTRPDQAGRTLYWFNATVLSPDWFKAAVDVAIADAGPRYTPELNVELPIALVFEGLGRTRAFETRLRTALRGVRDTRKWWSADRGSADKEEQIAGPVNNCRALLDDLDARVMAVQVVGTSSIDFDGLAAACTQVMDALDEAAQQFANKARDSDKQRQPNGDKQAPDRETRHAYESAAWELRRTWSSVDDMKDLLQSDAARLVNVPGLLVTGKPGTGKTHLLCDVAKTRCSLGQPTILLLGQKFSQRDPWAQILEQLNLSCGVDEFLGALDAAAEAADCRALIFLDALNEGEGSRLWPHHLVGFLQKVRAWPRVGVAMSCRTTYVEAVVPEALDATRLVRVNHEGFAGHEYRATQTFFEHYKLRLPDFPLLAPEFQNPLFLKLMCKSLHEAGLDTLPRGSTGVTSLFGQFIASVDRRLSAANHCDYPEHKSLVRTAAHEMANEMLQSGHDWLPLEAAEAISDRLLPGRGWANSLLNGLLSEGLLARERLHGANTTSEAVFFTHQRLGDHLRAAAFCKRCPSLEALSTELQSLAADIGTAWRHSGLLEALSVHIPERFARELHELVPDPSLPAIQHAYLESLIWRDPKAFPSPPSLDYLNTIASSSYVGSDPVLLTVLQLACVPHHPFNADLLHSALWRLSMPDRDAWWSVFLHWNSDEGSPVTRMIDWAGSEDTSYCADDAALLCATTLAWYLTSSNRFLRDRATKALVSLLKGRPNALTDLLARFHGVNDPYVAERLYCVAYGCCLISRDLVGVAAVAHTVYSLVFVDGQPPVHILLRDYARGVVECALHLDCLPDAIDLSKVRPPYHSPWPLRVPSEKTLKQRYYDNDDWLSIWSSVMSWGDFHRYIIEPAVSNFATPNQKKKQKHPASFDVHRASRWIFARVVKLGWTPTRFAQFELMVRPYGGSRTEHRQERIGKKYQWIAFHELLACIADHCPLEPDWGSDMPRPYQGAWQLWLRDIDPSLLLRSSHAVFWDTTPQCWWAPVRPLMPRPATPDARDRWTENQDDLPLPANLIDLTDPEGKRWLTIEGYYEWYEELPPELDRHEVDRCSLWYQIRSYLVADSDLPSFVNWAKGKNWMGRWMPESHDLHRIFLGEYVWHPAASDTLRTWEQPTHVRGKLPVPILVTAAAYRWESGGFDWSVDDTVHGLLPSSALLTSLELTWQGKDFRYLGSQRQLVAQDPTATESGPAALLIDYDTLTTYLEREHLSVVWTVLGEKSILGPAVQSTGWLEVFGCFPLSDGSVSKIHLATRFHTRQATP